MEIKPKIISNKAVIIGSLSLLSATFYYSGTELLKTSIFQWNNVTANLVEKMPTNNGRYYKGITTNEIKGYFEGGDKRKIFGLLNYFLFYTTGILALLIFIGYFDVEPALALIPVENKPEKNKDTKEVVVPPTIIRDGTRAEVKTENPFVLNKEETIFNEIFESDDSEEEEFEDSENEDDELQEIITKIENIWNDPNKTVIDRMVENDGHIALTCKTGSGKTTTTNNAIYQLAQKYYG